MVAKGHDFPNATALAVLDADALLSFPDFRAAERTFQLVTQAAGRVGRGDKPGIVAVQTSRPDHEAIRAAVRQDHVAFADAELRFRKAFRYPPYTRLLLALFADADLAKAHRAAGEAFAALASSPVASRVKLLGPAPAPLERLKGCLALPPRREGREARGDRGSGARPRGAARPAEAGRRPAEPALKRVRPPAPLLQSPRGERSPVRRAPEPRPPRGSRSCRASRPAPRKEREVAEARARSSRSSRARSTRTSRPGRRRSSRGTRTARSRSTTSASSSTTSSSGRATARSRTTRRSSRASAGSATAPSRSSATRRAATRRRRSAATSACRAPRATARRCAS